MRLAGIEKVGFYPTPPTVVECIANWLDTTGHKAIALDPCCGAGAALAQVANAHPSLETYGVEISADRAAVAREVLDYALCAPWSDVTFTNRTASLLWLNPPYDWEEHVTDESGKHERKEYTFLRNTTPRLVKEGVLVYIIPQNRIDHKIARYLAGHYHSLAGYCFPDGEYEAFRQVVIFGLKRDKHDSAQQEQTATIAAWKTQDLAPLPETTSVPYIIPPSGKQPRFFRFIIPDDELVKLGTKVGVAAFDEVIAAAQAQEQALTPAMPLKMGHVAMLMAAGLLGTMQIDDLLVKGRVVKQIAQVSEPDPTDEHPERVKVTEREQFVTQVTTVTRDGLIETISDVKALSEFMRQYGEKVGNMVIDKHEPAYDLHPLSWEEAVAQALGKNLPPLPNRTELGMFPAQKHVAIALARAMRAYGHAIINGEMGVGKTLIATTVVELLEHYKAGYPALVICPTHLVDKWAREVSCAAPGTKAYIIDTAVRKGDKDKRLSMARFLEQYRAGLLEHKAVAVASKETVKLGPGWRPAVIEVLLLTKGGYTVVTTPETLKNLLWAARRPVMMTGHAMSPAAPSAARNAGSCSTTQTIW